MHCISLYVKRPCTLKCSSPSDTGLLSNAPWAIGTHTLTEFEGNNWCQLVETKGRGLFGLNIKENKWSFPKAVTVPKIASTLFPNKFNHRTQAG